MLKINLLLVLNLVLFNFFGTSHGFSECPNSNLADPTLSGVNDCLSWLAYLQSQGQNIQQWCNVQSNYQKCCLTCQNYQSLAPNCVDIAYGPDCALKASQGLCNSNLADAQQVRDYCKKSCGLCTSISSFLTCNSLAKTCNSGSCQTVSLFSVSTIRCICPSSFAGAYCQRTNPCLQNPCLNGGVCSALNDETILYTCSCAPGFTGTNCQTSTGGCSTSPCLNGGQCQSLGGSNFICNCPAGFSGTFCQVLSNPCSSSPCLNSGSCSVTNLNTFFCICPSGFAGTRCESLVLNPCSSNPCLNGGFCSVSNSNTFFCSCPSNYGGSRCETLTVNPCSSSPCLNGGACSVSGINSFICSCPANYFGSRCESLRLNGCNSNPCLNQALCNSNSDGTFICVCLPGFTGAFCQISNQCANNPCLNGGSCTILGNGYVCSCPSGFSGTNCQVTTNSCSTNPCQNGGTCALNAFGQPVCTCRVGFSGAFCQSTGTCLTNPCSNGATCLDQTSSGSSYFCQCAANFYGRNCEFQVTTQICNAGDTNPSFCSVWSAFNFCSFTYTYNLVPVPIYCPTSCGICKGVSSCIDSQANCAIWANLGLCNTVNARDPNLCKRSCGLCGNLIKKKK